MQQLTFRATDIIERITGRQPRRLTLMGFHHNRLMVDLPDPA